MSLFLSENYAKDKTLNVLTFLKVILYYHTQLHNHPVLSYTVAQYTVPCTVAQSSCIIIHSCTIHSIIHSCTIILYYHTQLHNHPVLSYLVQNVKKIEWFVHRLIFCSHYKLNNSMLYIACHQAAFPALVNILPVFLRNPQVHYPPLVPVLNYTSPIHALLSYFCQVILILSSFLRYDCQAVSFLC